MEERVVSLDLLQNLINQHEAQNSVRKVLSLEFFPLSKGENYMSDSSRVKALILKGDGTTEPQYLFAKVYPDAPNRQKFLDELNFFPKEIKVYREVLPLMSQLLHSIGDYTENEWPEFIANQETRLILLKDLASKGYKTGDRRKCLDFEHSCLVFKSIAKFHALSVIIKARALADITSFNRYVFVQDETFLKLMTARTECLIELMKNWGSKWNELRIQLKSILADIPDILKRNCALNEEGFNVLNHGDVWTTNILFKYCVYTGNLCGIKYADYQVVHYNSFATDIQYFLHSSVQPKLRKECYNDFLRIYHASLEEWLTKFDHHRIPTLSEVEAEVRRKLFSGVIINVAFLHLMQARREDVIDFDKGSDEGNDDPALHIINTEEYQTKLKEIVEQLLDEDIKSII